MKSNLVSKTETAAILREVTGSWGVDVPKVKNLRVYHIDDSSQIITGKGVRILRTQGLYVPFLSETGMLERFPRVVVDMGAVGFMCKGANLMRPGIRSYSEFQKDGLVCITEESRHKFLAVGKATVASADLEEMQKGEVLKNLHYVSDRFWEIGKEIRD